jgi:PhzF family phenazine biosynthesis protein
MTPKIPYFLVDAFADRAFSGNPAVVCVLPEWKDDPWLQKVAAEMNQSETAFLVKNGSGYDLRWLTPKVEVDLCGHATLASAHVLWEHGFVERSDVIPFSTRSGVLKASLVDEHIQLDFPLEPVQPVAAPANLLAALQVRAKSIAKSRFDFLIEVESEQVLRQMTPDFRLLASIETRGVIITSRSDDPHYDFVSRFFAPMVGIDEDPVTGSAHCSLAYYWRERLGKESFTAYQASPRGGILGVRIKGDRVLLRGKAITVASGNLLVS